MNKTGKSHSSKIRYVDGLRLRNAIIASIAHLEQHLDYLNKINVFPVPDGDTGTNMFLTMRHISSGLVNLPDRAITIVSSQMAESALLGAQGNSGAILAQFFHGFDMGVKGKWQLTTRAFATAVQNAKKAALETTFDPEKIEIAQKGGYFLFTVEVVVPGTDTDHLLDQTGQQH